MFFKNICLKNILSYGPAGLEIPLRAMNILIGANGCGKSNLFEAISLLRSTPSSLVTPIRRGGGVVDWLWKGDFETVAELSFTVAPVKTTSRRPYNDMRYVLDFTVVNNRFEIVKEELTSNSQQEDKLLPYFYYQFNSKSVSIRSCTINNAKRVHTLERKDIDPESSVFAQFKDPVAYPEITQLGKQLSDIKIYREWHFGIDCPMRQAQPTDGDSSWLSEDCSNLALVLSTLLSDYDTSKKIRHYVKNIYDGAEDISIGIAGGRAITQIVESDLRGPIPANRLSDGTLRYLCLMAILLNPKPCSLICLDEPELGMHPDMINSLADMLREASERSQIIINTHSPILLDALCDHSQDVLVCCKQDGCTQVAPLTDSELALSKSESLGTLWMRGEIGGTRW